MYFNKTVNGMQLRTNGDKLHQTDRNAMRMALIQDVKALLCKYGVECGMVADGLAVNVEHEELGAINFVLDLKMKNLDYDYDFEIEDYEARMQEARARQEQKMRDKKAAIARDKAKRESQKQD